MKIRKIVNIVSEYKEMRVFGVAQENENPSWASTSWEIHFHLLLNEQLMIKAVLTSISADSITSMIYWKHSNPMQIELNFPQSWEGGVVEWRRSESVETKSENVIELNDQGKSEQLTFKTGTTVSKDSDLIGSS